MIRIKVNCAVNVSDQDIDPDIAGVLALAEIAPEGHAPTAEVGGQGHEKPMLQEGGVALDPKVFHPVVQGQVVLIDQLLSSQRVSSLNFKNIEKPERSCKLGGQSCSPTQTVVRAVSKKRLLRLPLQLLPSPTPVTSQYKLLKSHTPIHSSSSRCL